MKAKVIAVSLLLILSFPFLAAAKEKKAEEASAGWTPFQFAVWKPVQLFDENRDVYGLRMSLFYGKNRDVYGLDVGVIYNKAREVRGVQFGGINDAIGVKGLQIGLINLAGSSTRYKPPKSARSSVWACQFCFQ